MKYAIMAVLGLAALAFLRWRLTPPADVVGSYLPKFEDEWGQRRFLRAAADQDFNMFH